MEPNATTNVTARTTLRVILKLVNAFVNVDGLGERVTKSAQLAISVKIVKRDAQITCHRRQHAIM